jgi:molybdenum cofactor cytidylyltransferase
MFAPADGPVKQIAGLLLAAGRGTRFGGDKLRAQLPGEPLGSTLGVVAGRHLRAALPMSVAIVRHGDRALEADLAGVGLRIVRCASADDGMSASLACGVRATRDAGGWVVALGDMPWIDPATIRAVAAAIASGADIAAPSFRGTRGHPVGFARRYARDLCALTGDAGARAIVEREHASLTLIDVDDPGVLRDVDTREPR